MLKLLLSLAGLMNVAEELAAFVPEAEVVKVRDDLAEGERQLSKLEEGRKKLQAL